jgi:hypothetical protein
VVRVVARREGFVIEKISMPDGDYWEIRFRGWVVEVFREDEIFNERVWVWRGVGTQVFLTGKGTAKTKHKAIEEAKRALRRVARHYGDYNYQV